PNADLDTEEFCWIDASCIDANSCGVTPISDFYAADYPDWREDDKWFPARNGLDTVNGLLEYHKRNVAARADPMGRNSAVIEEKIALLEELARVLNAADAEGAFFCIAVTDQR
ncbi:MAG: hypothetical protein JJ992_30445, partial [Planctomycetes bacterium]|nr:hypothetical protein [Planctomycetota bacterium]